jgi:hypothetical protein
MRLVCCFPEIIWSKSFPGISAPQSNGVVLRASIVTEAGAMAIISKKNEAACGGKMI